MGEGGDDAVQATTPSLPQMPEVLVIAQSITHYQRREDGGMLLAFTPVLQGARGPVPTGRQIRVVFNPSSWDRFKAEVAADGEKVPVVRLPPPGFRL